MDYMDSIKKLEERWISNQKKHNDGSNREVLLFATSYMFHGVIIYDIICFDNR